MFKLLLILAIVLILVIVVEVYFGGKKEWGYRYNRKKYFMTRAEHEFFNTLMAVTADKYHIFAQVHLPTLLDHKVKGQDWRGAFSHISQKSVDFVLCEKEFLSPKLAIELDDWSHERPDRIERDHEVERILEGAGFPLLRLKDNRINQEDLKQKINSLIV